MADLDPEVHVQDMSAFPRLYPKENPADFQSALLRQWLDRGIIFLNDRAIRKIFH
jgi:hypothetical protein